jgi:biopolymer transport protein ExbB/TolQ
MPFVVEFFRDGGIFMYFILGVSVASLGIVLERGWVVLFRHNINAAALMEEVQKLVMANHVDRAVKLCNAEGDVGLARVLRAGLLRSNRTVSEMQSAMDEAALEVVSEIQRRTPYLGMWANVATLFGLLGTVQGLILAFHAVAAAAPEEKQSMLAAGIAIAMYTTAAGLVVAIPTMVLHSFLSNRSTRLVDEIDTCAVKLLNLLAARQRGTLKEDAEATAIAP